MPAVDPENPSGPRRRMSPQQRREHITETARHLFAERPYSTVSTQDIADAAGVARSLVHHYFSGIKDVFLAVVASSGAALADVRDAGPETPFAERIARNVAASLDIVDANRETWMAVIGHGVDSGDPQIRMVVAAVRERGVNRNLAANADLLEDTPATRYALRCFQDFTAAATRSWILGEATRAEAEALIVGTGMNLMQVVIPTLQEPNGRE
jgi:AcrR family transcriptional regulator